MYRDDLIRAAKAAQRKTLDALKQETGLNPNTISDICNGKPNPELKSLQKVASALGLEMEDLFSPKHRRRVAA